MIHNPIFIDRLLTSLELISFHFNSSHASRFNFVFLIAFAGLVSESSSVLTLTFWTEMLQQTV